MSEVAINTQSVAGTAQLILANGDNNDITIMTAEEPTFSKDNMIGAISYLESYLTPTPSGAEKKSFDYTKFGIKDSPKEVMQKFIEDVVVNGTVLSMETILLSVECIMRSRDAVKKAIFRLDEKKDTSGGKFIFKKWLSYVIQIMENKRKQQNALPANEARTEELIAISIMELICSYSVIKKQKQLEVLKKKFGVDWVFIVEKTAAFASAHKITGLLESCKKADRHLKNVMDGKMLLPYKPKSLPPILATKARKTSKPSQVTSTPRPSGSGSGTSKSEVGAESGVKQTPTTDTGTRLNNNEDKVKQKDEQSTRGGSSSQDYRDNNATSTNEARRQSSERKAWNSETSSNNSRSSWGNHSRPSSHGSGGWGSTKSSSNISPPARVVSNDERMSDRRDDNSGNDFGSSSWKSGQSMARTGSHESNNQSRRGPTLDSLNYGELEKNKVTLSCSPSKGVDGLADLPGYSAWKTNNYDDYPAAKAKDTPKSSYQNENFSLNKHDLNSSSGGVDGLADLPGYSSWKNQSNYDYDLKDVRRSNNRQSDSRDYRRSDNFDRKRNERSSDYDNGWQPKRQRVDERASSNQSNNWRSSQSNSSGLGTGRGRGKDRTLPAWMSKGEFKAGVDSTRDKQLPKQDTTPSPSIGRGRGKDRTLPAWMSKSNNSNSPRESSRIQEKPQTTRPPEYNIAKSERFDASAELSRGRGRGRTLPAWMTQQNGGDAISNTESTRNQSITPATAVHNKMAQDAPPSSREKESRGNYWNDTRPNQNSAPANFSGASTGLGRGRDRTVPAWMTKSKEAQSFSASAGQPNESKNSQNLQTSHNSNNMKNATFTPSSQDSRGRGRGRTLPAWMTKQDSSASMAKVNEPISRVSQERSRSRPTSTATIPQRTSYNRTSMDSGNFRGRGSGTGSGTGRGRGKDQTLPAWMTRNGGRP